MGTAPGATRERKGINDQSVKLACVMPGEPIAVFGDALRRLGDRGRYIQQDGDRYWIDTSPNLNRTAEDYRESYLRQNDELLAELNQQIAKEAGKRGDFAGVHAAQIDSSGIPDEPATRLVLMAAQYTHRRGVDFSAALQWAGTCLQSKGNSPRQYQNTLVFLAPDEQSLENLFFALADRRAWQRVVDEKLLLNLTVNQINQAAAKIQDATSAIAARIPETWCHLLVPYQSEPGPNGALWDEKRLTGGKGSLAERTAEKCIQEDLLANQLGARAIRDKLNDFLWKERQHVEVRELVDWCRKYLYLPRITADQVILDALVNPSAALSGEATFYLADSFDEASGLYQGLRPQQASSSQLPSLNSLVVKEEVAKNHLAEAKPVDVPPGSNGGATGATGLKPELPPTGGGGGTIAPPITPPIAPPVPAKKTTFTASLKLDPKRAGLQMGDFLDEVMSHLQALPGAEVNLSVEVQVKVPEGIDDATARVVLENSRSLKVDNPQVY
jgi:hypothetical protein